MTDGLGVYGRIQAGETLWDDQRFLTSLLENTSEGLLTIDSESRIVFANPAIEDILGYRPDELVGSSKMKLIPERLRSTHFESLKQYVETDERHIDWDGIDLPAVHKDGHEVPVSVSLREHEYEGERLFTGIFTDITERKRHEQRLQAQNAELEEFADVLAHDLRNPLSVAKGYTEIVRETEQVDELSRVESSLSRMEEIIDEMLARARNSAHTSPSDETLSLRGVMAEAWASVLAPEAHLVLPDETWTFSGSRGRLKQLAENVFRNSVEHGSTSSRTQSDDAVEHGGSTVTVRIGVLETADGFYIEDTGPGFPESTKEQLRTPGELPVGSTGSYGLHIVTKIATEHGWDVVPATSASGGARLEFHNIASLSQ